MAEEEDEGEHDGRQGAPATPSVAGKLVASPLGVTCTRTAALGLPTPLLAGLFDRSNSVIDRNSKENPQGGYVGDDLISKEKMSSTTEAEANDQSEEGGPHGSLGDGKDPLDSSGENDRKEDAKRDRWGSRDKLARHGTWDPSQLRKGHKLGQGPRARTLPLRVGDGAVGLRDSAEDGTEDG